MAQMTADSSAKVVALQGKAVARAAGGGVRLLSLGDWVAPNDVIITAQNGFVQLASAEGASAAAFGGGISAAAMAPMTAPVIAPLSNGPSPTSLNPNLAAPNGSSLQSAFRAEALSDASPGLSGLARETAVSLAQEQRSVSVRNQTDRSAPTANDMRLSTSEDTPLAIRLSGHDAQGSLSRYLVLKVPTGGVLSKPGGVPISDGAVLLPAEAERLVFSPAPDFHGNPGALQYRVLDNAGKLSAVASVGLTVTAVNDAPLPGTVPLGPDDVAIADPSPQHLAGTPDYRYSTPSGTPLSGRVQATDVDLDPMRFSTATAPEHGTVVLQADGRFVYQATAGYLGSDQFVVQVDDGRGGVATSTVYLDIGTATPQSADALPHAFSLSQDVFAWTLAEAAAATGPDGLGPVSGAATDTLTSAAIHAPLDLRDLLPGLAEELMLPGSPNNTPAGAAFAPALPADNVLDLFLGHRLDHHLDLAMGWGSAAGWHRPATDPLREPPGYPAD
jgi:VCBS repeat-containing protein